MELPETAVLVGELLGVLHARSDHLGARSFRKSVRRIFRTRSTKRSNSAARLLDKWPLKMTRSKQERDQEIRLANLVKKEHTVFMASAF